VRTIWTLTPLPNGAADLSGTGGRVVASMLATVLSLVAVGEVDDPDGADRVAELGAEDPSGSLGNALAGVVSTGDPVDECAGADDVQAASATVRQAAIAAMSRDSDRVMVPSLRVARLTPHRSLRRLN
jgi:hypothetical protein